MCVIKKIIIKKVDRKTDTEAKLIKRKKKERKQREKKMNLCVYEVSRTGLLSRDRFTYFTHMFGINNISCTDRPTIS